MSYVAEPYAQFVDDLLTGMTGGAVRQRFVFLPEQAPFQLTSPGSILPGTVRVFGMAGQSWRRFQPDVDYKVGDDFAIVWRSDGSGPDGNGAPAADAVWPDEATPFFVNFEQKAPGGAVPLLTDRNVGGVTRLLAESFAREYAVLSGQLEAVYRAGFLDTAGGRDLDQIVSLVGIARRLTTFAAGSVVFERSSPSPADIFIPAGTRISTLEPPSSVFETTQDGTLRRGDLSVEIPIQALEPGDASVVAEQAIGVIHRPILGVERVYNPQPTKFSSADESDEALRTRARRALEGAGKATTGALLSALTTLPGVREKDIRIAEDHLVHPGIVKLTLAVPEDQLDEDARRRAIQLIEDVRPVGVRIEHNIQVPASTGESSAGDNTVLPESEAPVSEAPPGEGLFYDVAVKVQVVPASLELTPTQRNDLKRLAEDTVTAFIEDAGIGEVLVYNRLVARLMALEGVLDVVLELYPEDDPAQPHHKNLVPSNPNTRPQPGTLDVQIGGALIALDVTATLTLKGTGLLGDQESNRTVARDEIDAQLRDGLKTLVGGTLSESGLKGLLTASDSYTVTAMHYRVDFVEAGVRVHQQDIQLEITELEQLWLRSVALSN